MVQDRLSLCRSTAHAKNCQAVSIIDEVRVPMFVSCVELALGFVNVGGLERRTRPRVGR